MRNTSQLRWALALLAGVYLLSDPRCRHGCRTVAEHLIDHGIQGLLGG